MNLQALTQIQSHLQKARQSVKLVAVTKYANVKTAQQLIEAGVEAVGENRLEVAEQKFAQLPSGLQFEKHFIGQIQSKKIRKIVELFDVIQSVSSNKHLLKLDQVAGELGKKIQIFLQFNVSNEPQKGGYSPADAEDVKKILSQIAHVEVIGLMGMASNTKDEQMIRTQFKTLRELRNELQKDFPSIKELSMGMSNDYQIAIEEGATVVRIGRGLGI